VHAYTERVPLQLMDFAYRYMSGILSDAIAYEPPSHGNTASSKKKDPQQDESSVSLNAVRTAIAARVANQFAPALPKEFMAEIAAERNRIALPRVEREFGVRLPPERYCFTGVGWDVKQSWEEEVEEMEDEEEQVAMAGGPVGGGDVDTDMGGMGGVEEEDVDEDEFEDVMGVKDGDAMVE
jgi:transcription initiation factor TFIID subunit 9B